MRYRVELLAIVAFSSGCPCAGTEERTSHPREEAARPSASDTSDQPELPPNPPNVIAIQRWGNNWIATTSTYKYSNDPSVPRERWHFYVVDVRNLGVAELVVPKTRRVLAVTPSPMGEPLALAKASSGIRLVEKRDAAWQSVDIPAELAASEADRFLITASKERLAVFNDHEVWTRTNQQWEHFPLPKPPEGTQNAGIPDHLLLDGARLYMGFDRGEFGGGVLVLNLETRAWELGEGPKADSLPVHGFAKSPDGSVWVAEGLAHLSIAEGALRELRDGKWRPLVRASKEGRIGWKRSATNFSGLAFDSSQRPHLLTGDYGVLRRQDGSWKQLTRSWPGDSYAGGLVLADDHTALFWTLEGRILVWNLRTDQATKIVLPSKSW